MKYLRLLLFSLIVGCALGSKNGLQQYWRYNFENSIPSANIIDIDYSQANEVAVCLGSEVKYYVHDGTTYIESATISETCTSVAISKGPHLDDTSGDTQLMIGNSATSYVYFYKKDGAAFTQIFSYHSAEDNIGVEVAMPTAGKYSATVGSKKVCVFIFNDDQWSHIHTKEISSSASTLHVDMNHDDVLIVSNENVEVVWYKVTFSDLTQKGRQAASGLSIGKSVASTVSCKGSQIAYAMDNTLVIFLQNIDSGDWTKTQSISGDILDVEMSLCMIAVKLPTKVQLYMLEQLEDGSFGNNYILSKQFDANGEGNFGKKIAFKLSDLAILSDSYLSFFRNAASTKCRKDFFLNSTSGDCVVCPIGTFNDHLTTANTCTPNACGINEKSKNGVCVSCEPGTTNAAGDTTDADTECDVVTCEVDQYVNSQNQCGSCPKGTSTFGKRYTTDKPDTSVCEDIICERNQYVENNECKDCLTGSTAAPGAKASGSDTQCLVGKCAANQYVKNAQCHPCAPGSTAPADSPMTVDTTCTAQTCALNQKVEDHACVACGPNSFRAAGDQTTSANTYCTCNDNFYTDASGACVQCAPGKTKTASTAAPGAATTCADIICNVNQYVENNECKDCKANSHFEGKSVASGADTYCYCDENYRSSGNRQCVECVSPSYMKPKGDKTDAATSCLCAHDFKNSGSATCAQCPQGSERKEHDSLDLLTETFCTCVEGYRSKGDGTCEQCPIGYTTIEKKHSKTASTCVCAENYRVSASQCVQCFQGATRPAGDNPAGDNTFCAYEGKVIYMGFDTDRYTSPDTFNNVISNPTLTVRLGETYSFVRSSTGSPLRILSASDCPDCVNGNVPSPVPASSISSSDSIAPHGNVAESVAVLTPVEVGTLYYVSTDGSATVVGQITVKYQQCTSVDSSGTVKLKKSCTLKQTVTLSGDLTIEAEATASRRFKLRGGNKIILSGDNLHRHFIVKNGYKLTLKNLDVKEGYSDGDGGAIYVDNGEVNIENSILRDNNVASGKKGGAIFAKTSAIVSISGSTIENNKAPGGSGGALYLDQADVANNKAVGVTIGSSTIKGNQADEGGSISLGKESSLTCTSCVFDENIGKHGGAVYASEKNNLDIRESEFKNNKATQNYGGAIESLSCSSMELSKVTFDGNEAEEGGGGIYSSYESGDHTCVNTILEINFQNNLVKSTGKKGGAAMHLGAASSALAAKQQHTVTASNFTNNKVDTSNNDVSWNEGSAQVLRAVDQDTAVGLEDGPSIATTCHKHACFFKPLASGCSEAGAGKIGVKCGCDMGVNTISADTSLKKTQMKTVITILFASENVATDIIRTVDDNNRYVPPKGSTDPAAAKAAAEAAPVLAKPINKEGEAVGEKTVLMKPTDPGKTLCTSFQSFLCEKVTACSSGDGTVTVECDGVQYFPAPASAISLPFNNNGNDHFIYNNQDDPQIDLCLNQEYTVERTSAGHPLRIVTDADCTGCDSGTHSNPTSSISGWSDVTSGNSHSITFTQAGTYYYVCTAHPTMVGKIIVASCAARRRLRSVSYKPLHKLERRFNLGTSSNCIENNPPDLQQQCSGLDPDGNAITFDRCKANALMSGDGVCVCADGYKVSPTGDACEALALSCRRDEHVVNGVCTACAEGTYNLEGDSVALVNTVCDDNYCPENYHVVNGQCAICPQGEHTPGFDDKNIVGGTKCCKADEYEYTPPTPNINNNGGGDRVCKKCYGNTDAKLNIEKRYTDLRCCTKSYDYQCNRIFHGYNAACADESASTCAGFVKYGTKQQGEACAHANECDSGVCTSNSCV